MRGFGKENMKGDARLLRLVSHRVIGNHETHLPPAQFPLRFQASFIISKGNLLWECFVRIQRSNPVENSCDVGEINYAIQSY